MPNENDAEVPESVANVVHQIEQREAKARHLTPEKKAQLKAWRCVKRLLADDAKYQALRFKHEPIELKGSLGGRYILYPNGHVIDLKKNEPALGRIQKSGEMPYPDVLATIIAWILHDEARFKKNWGCGSISIREESQSRIELDQRLQHYGVFERSFHRRKNRSSFMFLLAVMIPFGCIAGNYLHPMLENFIVQAMPTNTPSTSDMMAWVITIAFMFIVARELEKVLRRW